MGICWNCDTEITLKDEEIKCDNCGEIVRYWCNVCKKPFDVQDAKTKKKLKECPACGFFICPYCNSCGPSCPKLIWASKMREILGIDFPQNKIKEIVDYFVKVKLGKGKRNCEFGVPISYAKSRIKHVLVKMDGYRTKSENDKTNFNRRMEKLSEKPIGYEFTVEQAREEGGYGQEYRDIFNLGICLGLVEPINKKNKKGETYTIFRRCEKGECPYFDKEKLIVNVCTKCGKEFSEGVEFCDTCKYKNTTKKHTKGDSYKTKIKISNKDTCQLPRGEFIFIEN